MARAKRNKALNIVRAQLELARKEMAAADQNYLNAVARVKHLEDLEAAIGKAYERVKAVKATPKERAKKLLDGIDAAVRDGEKECVANLVKDL